MRGTMCRSRIHRATVTAADLNYEGSITIDGVLMDAAGILPFEQVQVVDVDNGARFETYAIRGVDGAGDIVLNGAAARLVHRGDLVIIMTYAQYDEIELEHFQPNLVFVDESNRIRDTSPRRIA